VRISHYYTLNIVLVTFDSIINALNYIKEIEGPGDRSFGVNAGVVKGNSCWDVLSMKLLLIQLKILKQ